MTRAPHFKAEGGMVKSASATLTLEQAAGVRSALASWRVMASPALRSTYDTLIADLDAAIAAIGPQEIAA